MPPLRIPLAPTSSRKNAEATLPARTARSGTIAAASSGNVCRWRFLKMLPAQRMVGGNFLSRTSRISAARVRSAGP